MRRNSIEWLVQRHGWTWIGKLYFWSPKLPNGTTLYLWLFYMFSLMAFLVGNDWENAPRVSFPAWGLFGLLGWHTVSITELGMLICTYIFVIIFFWMLFRSTVWFLTYLAGLIADSSSLNK